MTDKYGYDLVAKVRLGDKIKKIYIEVKNNGQPRVARSAVTQLKKYCENSPDAYCMFAAPYISQQAAEICTNEGAERHSFRGVRSNDVTPTFSVGSTNLVEAAGDRCRWAVWVGRHT